MHEYQDSNDKHDDTHDDAYNKLDVAIGLIERAHKIAWEGVLIALKAQGAAREAAEQALVVDPIWLTIIEITTEAATAAMDSSNAATEAFKASKRLTSKD